MYQYLCDEANAQHEVHASIEEITEAVEVKNGMAVSSAIAILSRHGYIERFDVPGQRRRGTRLRHPEVRVDSLEIDRTALEEKERRDRSKLEAMIDFCFGAGCRQRAILEYFGERDGEECGTCDVCRSDYGTEAREPTEQEDLVVRKALSGVARMSRRTAKGWDGIFGRVRIVQMLTGSKSQEILRVRLHELSTYAILREKGTAYLNELFHSLHDAGLLVTQRGEYPLVTLTPRGERVMKGQGSYRLVWPEAQPEQMTKGATGELTDDLAPFDPILYTRLKDVRTRLAAESQLPAYGVFSNKTLEAFTRLRPKTVEAAMRIKGVGTVKAERFLEPFLDVIRESG